jgi:BASS family bile acid:Na+ symporter
VSPALFALLVAGVAAGPCSIAALAVVALEVEADLALGLFAAVAGPPVASAAALAAILGLPPRFALALWIPPTLLCPLAAPLLLGVYAGAAVDAVALGWRLVALVGGAALAAALALSMRRRSTAAPSPLAAAGVSVIGLVIVGVAAASRARVEAQADPAGFAALVLGAVALTVGLTLAGALAGAPLGGPRAATLGLVWGFRNQTLVWAALGAGLPPAAERFVVAMVLPILIAPMAVRAGQVVWRLRRRAWS